MRLSATDIWVWLVCLLALELGHLKWIWWEHWQCRSCHVANRCCSCGRARRVMRYF